jgi:hypothetical protein
MDNEVPAQTIMAAKKPIRETGSMKWWVTFKSITRTNPTKRIPSLQLGPQNSRVKPLMEFSKWWRNTSKENVQLSNIIINKCLNLLLGVQ